VTSASRGHGNQFSVCVDGDMIDVPGENGIGIVVIDYRTRGVSSKNMYDTSHELSESHHLVKAIDGIKDGNYVIMGVKGEGAKKLSNELIKAISSLGSEEIGKLEYGDSWAMITRKGCPTSTREARQHEAVTLQRTDIF